MAYAVKPFMAGVCFESNTTYVADRMVYHLYPGDAAGNVRCWYTLIQAEDPPLIAAFILQDLENVTIDLGGAKLVFHGRIMPFAVYNCRNISFKNFSVDYDRPFYTQGTLTDVSAGSLTLDIPGPFGYRIENGNFIAMSDSWENNLNHGSLLLQPYDPDKLTLSESTGMILGLIGETISRQPNPPCEIHHLHARQLDGRKVRLSGFPDTFTPRTGEILAFTHENRHKTGFQIENCIDTSFENIRLIHIGALALIANLCHNIYFHNFSCYLDDACKGRIISVNADIIHGFHCTGKIVVEDCRFENMLDDALNFHGNYTLCDNAIDRKSFTVVNRSAGLRDIEIYKPGDLIYVYRGSTQELKAAYTVEEAHYLPGEISVQKITVREPLHQFSTGDIIESRRMPEIEIRRCVSAKARGGWRISSGKRVVIEDCRFENTPLMFTGDTNYWFENSPVRDVEIKNCIFEHFTRSAPILSMPIFEPTGKNPYYHSGIRISDNMFIDCRKGLISMKQTSGIRFQGNTCLETPDHPENANEIVLRDCSDVSILR